FLARGRKGKLFLKANEVVLPLQTGAESEEIASPQTLPLKLADTNPAARLEGLSDLPGKANYFSGGDPAGWRLDVPTFARVRYGEIYPGIDLIFYGSDEKLEFDFILRPGANVDLLRLEFTGPEKLRLDANGDLLLEMSEEGIR